MDVVMVKKCLESASVFNSKLNDPDHMHLKVVS